MEADAPPNSFESATRYGSSHWVDDGAVVDEIPRYLPEGFLPFNIPQHAKKNAATAWYRNRVSQAQLPNSALKPNTDLFDIALCERVMEQLRDLVITHCSKGLFDIYRLSSDSSDGQSGNQLFFFEFLLPFHHRLLRLTQIQLPALEIIPYDPKCCRLLFECGQSLVGIAELVLCSESFAFQTADRFLPCTKKNNVVLKGILFHQARLGAQLLATALNKLTMNECLECVSELKKVVAAQIGADMGAFRERFTRKTTELSPYVCPALVVPYVEIGKCNALHGALAAFHFDRLFHLAEMVRSKLVSVLNYAHGGASVKAGLLLLDIGAHFYLIFDARFLDALCQLNAQKVGPEDESELQAIYPYDPDVLKNDNRRRNRIYMKYFMTRQIYAELQKFVKNIMEKRIGLPEKCCLRLRGATLNDDTPECVWFCLSWLALLINNVCEVLNAKDPDRVTTAFSNQSVDLLNKVISPFVVKESVHQASVNVYCNVLTGKLNTLFNY